MAAASDPHDWSQWQGQALVVGRGGIGRALLAALPRHCPQLELWSAGRDPQEERHLRLDLGDDASLAAFARLAAQHLPNLRLVIHTSGLLHDDQQQPEKRLAQVRRDWLERSFAINAWGPLLLAQALEEKLPRGLPCRFASLSARVGSIGDNRLGGWYAYRAAKAAQNQLLTTLALEWRRRRPLTSVTLLHPGTTATPLSEPFRGGVAPERLFSAETAAEHLLTVLAGQRPEHSGAFLAWDGQPIPW
ncbi:MAG: SDR family NAD(P)-dependent oxidoreductase [Synechococcaceae cyanobacterium]|nr:SDR family NAD(P)-dependent oxidoreductase [Synechococcaceae cyanobacterium]